MRLLLVLTLLAMLATAAVAEGTGRWRVVETKTGRTLRWRDLAGRLVGADAIFVGEQHDDPETHRVEERLLRDVHQKLGGRLTLAMEMFERDGQKALEDYLAGAIDGAALGRAVTLWKNFETDYQPLVDYARRHAIPVLGSNAPQKIVRRVGREGLASLATLTEAEKATVAAFVTAPDGDLYYQRFTRVMQGDGGAHGMTLDAAQLRRIYEAQCVRDDTMGETVARALAEGRVVYHVNGSFHSDAALGTVARTLWRRALGTRLAVVKVVPVRGDPRSADPAPLRGEADFLIFVPDTRPGVAP